MNRSTTAQEALVAELIGDLAKLIKRAESFATTLDNAKEELRDAAFLLDSRVEPFRHALNAEVGKVKDIAIKAFIRQTNEIAEREQMTMSRAMSDAARDLVGREVIIPLRQLVLTLDNLIHKTTRPWEVWSVNAATAIVSALASGLLVFHFFGR